MREEGPGTGVTTERAQSERCMNGTEEAVLQLANSGASSSPNSIRGVPLIQYKE